MIPVLSVSREGLSDCMMTKLTAKYIYSYVGNSRKITYTTLKKVLLLGLKSSYQSVPSVMH